jgi:hypothetical protein
MKVGAELSGWEAFHADRTARRDAATDEGTRQHFEAELEQARVTMQAMGLEVPTSPSSEAPPVLSASVEQKSPNPGDNVFSDESLAGYVPESSITPTGSTELSPIGDENLERFRPQILAASEATGVPADLLAAVIWDESKGIASAGTINGENGLTDSGLMQINPQTFADLQSKHPELLAGDATDPATNIMAGALYLKEQYDQFGDWDLALRAYNSGPLSVDPSDHTISTTGFGTKNYVEKVNFYQDLLAQGEALPDGYPGGNEYY